MSGRRWAVLIGINQCGMNVSLPSLRYAEADARSMRGILTDPQIGTFDDKYVQLITSHQATAPTIKQHLRQIVQEADATDTLFVYFAGHAVVPDWSTQSDAYLATADLDVDGLITEPERGLRMSFLRRDIFEDFAGVSVLVLDCCHAGAYASSNRQHLPAIDIYGQQQLDRHSALLSCPTDANARETNEFRHGVVTHHLLRALQGAAAGPDGAVSFANMANFLVDQAIHPMPGHLVPMWGPTVVLTQSPTRQPPTQTPPQPSTLVKVVPCENPLEKYSSTIQQLLDRLYRTGRRIPHQGNLGRAVGFVEIICNALGADSVAVAEFSTRQPTLVDATPRFDEEAIKPLLAQCAHHLFPTVSPNTSLGFVTADAENRQMLCVPVKQQPSRVLALIVVDPPRALMAMGELLAGLLRAIHNVGIADDPVYAEVQVLTALRSAFGRLPLSLYEYCFSRYQELVASIVMVFQPVICLDRRPRGVRVHSYEALARRAENDSKAPVELLRIAHEWGERFIIERDTLLLTKAIQSYTEADAEASWGDGTRPVSINVAVRSLLSNTYIASMRSALHETRLDPGAVTLEISEQDPIKPATGEDWGPDSLGYFHRRLTSLANDLGISFAVDDFGVGYSSLARLAELRLTQIKVDRAVLHHPLAVEELKLVMQVARHAAAQGHAAARAVIVEGFDHHSPVTLEALYDLRVRHVQGFISEAPASRTLHPIDPMMRERIAALVRGEDDHRTSTTSVRDPQGGRPSG